MSNAPRRPCVPPGSPDLRNRKKILPRRQPHLPAMFSVLLFGANFCEAQTATSETLMLELPRQSQHAVVLQRIGITDITINYHRPLAKGRQLWGKVVPYGQV